MLKHLLLSLALIASSAQSAPPSRFQDAVVSGALKVGGTAAANSKSVLELSSTTKGMLPPRMSQTQRDAISAPPTGLTVYNTDTNKLNVYDGVAWGAVGGGGGAGGVNFIGQDTSWASVNTTDRDLETSVGNWVAFADAAAATPVDLTGGSPSVTCTRSTSNPLDGAASLLITKGAANRQGEGCSVVFNVQPQFQGGPATITFGLQVVSGSIVQGDVKLFLYDVTNSQLITPFNNDVVIGPTILATFPLTARAGTPANQQYRLGIYFASTSTTAVTLKGDGFSISPGLAAYGMAGSDWVAFTPTGNFTSNSTYTGFYRRVGGDMEVVEHVAFSGAPNSTTQIFNLPSGYNINTTLLVSGAGTVVGQATWYDSGLTANFGGQVIYSSGNAVLPQLQRALAASNHDFTNVNETTPKTWTSGDEITVKFKVPIAGWSSNVSIAESSVFKISSYLATGTRVTSAPANLGEYRSQLRNSNAQTFTDTNGAPTATPSVADGIKLYGGNAFNAADTNNQPTRYEIFIGKNKHYKITFFGTTGRTGYADVSDIVVSGADLGVQTSYDPTTGIILIQALRFNNSTTLHYSGLDETGSLLSNVFFDVTVSENALAVGMDTPRNELIFYTWAGYGSGASNTPYYTSVDTSKQGTLTYSNSSTSGIAVTIGATGLYNMFASHATNASSGEGVAITLDTVNTVGSSVVGPNRVCLNYNGGSNLNIPACSATRLLLKGQVVRVVTEAHVTPADATYDSFSITQVGF